MTGYSFCLSRQTSSWSNSKAEAVDKVQSQLRLWIHTRGIAEWRQAMTHVLCVRFLSFFSRTQTRQLCDYVQIWGRCALPRIVHTQHPNPWVTKTAADMWRVSSLWVLCWSIFANAQVQSSVSYVSSVQTQSSLIHTATILTQFESGTTISVPCYGQDGMYNFLNFCCPTVWSSLLYS